ncbi:hypothetical protein CGLO_17830 [Colletotrichum gloeosporioides Cg-14]|uniref:Uncharacterized protein n=1 Tax=Colletotrichum gloeosporioides (strain Cg-14) TaxID=1237896 RepID=T0KW26_COLGC|nr:hypothetical protein CGLO_17830 [Colletotrichum gloeosporioides Cg-14]
MALNRSLVGNIAFFSL